MKRVQNIFLGKKRIGKNCPIFVIAEAGVNHNGSLKIALKMVDGAAAAGADAIKFQTFKAEEVVTPAGEMANYQKKNFGKSENQLEMLKKLELPEKFYPAIIDRCRKKKIIFLSTPHGGFESVDFLQSFNAPAFKFGSGDLTNLPVLEYAARLKKPIILGTGMSTMEEVKEAVKCVKNAGNDKIIVLHCTSDYPLAFRDVNLRAMRTMMEELDVLAGYSDHTLSVQVPVMAATLGACVIEKHFTLDRNMPGPDHKASMEPEELKQMVKAVRDVGIIMGKPVKQPTKNETKNKPIGRKSVVAAIDIPKGERITREMLTIKRPGTGIEPKFINNIIGKKTKKRIKKDQFIKKKDLNYE